MRRVWHMLRDIAHGWSEHRVPRLAAALAYYTVFSLAPLLVIIIAIAGLLVDGAAVRQHVVGEFSQLVGDTGAQAVDAMIQGASQRKAGLVAGLISVGVLVVGAMSVFQELQDALNGIWGVQPKPHLRLIDRLRQRFVPFTMILGIGFLLLVSLVLSAGVSALGAWVADAYPTLQAVVAMANFVILLALTAVLFGMIYKVLPDVEIGWRDVWIGALVTAALFSVGRWLIGLYLAKSSVASTYGAAGSLVIVLVWVYYSSWILFLGAEFTKAYASHFGSGVRPSPHAERRDDAPACPPQGDREHQPETPLPAPR